MQGLTIYILQCGNPDIRRCVESLKDICINPIVTLQKDIETISKTCATPWFGYVFANEYFDLNLINAIPVFLNYNYDIIVLMGRIWNEKQEKYIMHQSPRIFKKGIEIEGVLPKDYKTVTRVLDGWVEG